MPYYRIGARQGAQNLLLRHVLGHQTLAARASHEHTLVRALGYKPVEETVSATPVMRATVMPVMRAVVEDGTPPARATSAAYGAARSAAWPPSMGTVEPASVARFPAADATDNAAWDGVTHDSGIEGEHTSTTNTIGPAESSELNEGHAHDAGHSAEPYAHDSAYLVTRQASIERLASLGAPARPLDMPPPRPEPAPRGHAPRTETAASLEVAPGIAPVLARYISQPDRDVSATDPHRHMSGPATPEEEIGSASAIADEDHANHESYADHEGHADHESHADHGGIATEHATVYRATETMTAVMPADAAAIQAAPDRGAHDAEADAPGGTVSRVHHEHVSAVASAPAGGHDAGLPIEGAAHGLEGPTAASTPAAAVSAASPMWRAAELAQAAEMSRDADHSPHVPTDAHVDPVQRTWDAGSPVSPVPPGEDGSNRAIAGGSPMPVAPMRESVHEAMAGLAATTAPVAPVVTPAPTVPATPTMSVSAATMVPMAATATVVPAPAPGPAEAQRIVRALDNTLPATAAREEPAAAPEPPVQRATDIPAVTPVSPVHQATDIAAPMPATDTSARMPATGASARVPATDAPPPAPIHRTTAAMPPADGAAMLWAEPAGLAVAEAEPTTTSPSVAARSDSTGEPSTGQQQSVSAGGPSATPGNAPTRQIRRAVVYEPSTVDSAPGAPDHGAANAASSTASTSTTSQRAQAHGSDDAPSSSTDGMTPRPPVEMGEHNHSAPASGVTSDATVARTVDSDAGGDAPAAPTPVMPAISRAVEGEAELFAPRDEDRSPRMWAARLVQAAREEDTPAQVGSGRGATPLATPAPSVAPARVGPSLAVVRRVMGHTDTGEPFTTAGREARSDREIGQSDSGAGVAHRRSEATVAPAWPSPRPVDEGSGPSGPVARAEPGAFPTLRETNQTPATMDGAATATDDTPVVTDRTPAAWAARLIQAEREPQQDMPGATPVPMAMARGGAGVPRGTPAHEGREGAYVASVAPASAPVLARRFVPPLTPYLPTPAEYGGPVNQAAQSHPTPIARFSAARRLDRDDGVRDDGTIDMPAVGPVAGSWVTPSAVAGTSQQASPRMLARRDVAAPDEHSDGLTRSPASESTVHVWAAATAPPASPPSQAHVAHTGGDAPVMRAPWNGLPAPWESLPDWLAPPRLTGPSADSHTPPMEAVAGASSVAPATRRVQRSQTTQAPARPPASSVQGPAPAVEPDLDALARQVFGILQRRLAAERRRAF